MTITLKAGDMLYLPALWFHHVAQGAEDEPEDEPTIALNWWYEMKMDSLLWSFTRMVRRLTRELDGLEPDSEGSDEEYL